MEDSICCYPMWERRLLARFPCISIGFSAGCTLPLKELESPWKSPNLSPEPIPKGPLGRDADDPHHGPCEVKAPGRSLVNRREVEYGEDVSQSLLGSATGSLSEG
jgi:hypothetical protein